MLRTISAMVGKGSVNHNSRKFKTENVDGNRTYLNIDYCNEPIKKVYHELFDDALRRYNEKQSRADRRIEDYYEKIRCGKQEKPFHELILQIGDKENMSAESENGALARKVLDEYFQTFQERNPNLRVFSAHLHMDEATPHLHIDFVPFTTGSKRGLDTRVSLKQALATQGFKGGTKGDTEWNQWVSAEKSALAYYMEMNGLKWEKKGTHEQHLSVMDFKKQEREKEVRELDTKLADKKDEFHLLVERFNSLDKAAESYDELGDALEKNPELLLPEPQNFMSVKSYKTKFVEPLIERLKDFAKKVLIHYFVVKDENNKLDYRNRQLSRENGSLSNTVAKLSDEVQYLRSENNRYKQQTNDYKLLRKVFGSKQIDSLIEQAKQSKQRDKRFRNNNYER